MTGVLFILEYVKVGNFRKKKYIRALTLAAAVACFSVHPALTGPIYAADRTGVATTQTGTGAVYIRTEPDTQSGTETSLTHGTTFTIKDETIGGDGCKWYRVSYTNNGTTYAGWVRGDLVRVQDAQESAEGAQSTSSESGQSETGGETSDSSGSAEEETPAAQESAGEESAPAEQGEDAGGVGAAEPPAQTEMPNTTSGTVSGDVVNVRSGAGTDQSQVTQITMGTAVTITGQQTAPNGDVWYAVTFSKNGQTYSGYMHSSYVTVTTPSASNDQEAIAAMESAGFPHSYAVYLATLHSKHPSWQFEPVDTGLDWGQVIAAESVPGRNLIPASFSDSTKSTDATVYNWNTNEWVQFEPGWVAPNSSYIAYIMDPRNYLSESYVFQFETLEYRPYQTAEGVRSILSNTFMIQPVTDTDGTTLDYADAFASIGSQLSVSPYHLASRVRQEQGVAGTSPMISGTEPGFEGYFNYFNISAYATAAASILTNGLTYAVNAGWNTRYASLLGGSDVVAKRYVATGQNTLYFEKFNVVDRSRLYTHQYMANLLAAQNEGLQMKKAYTNMDQAYVFRIPVYQNMPEEPSSFADSGNPNNRLASFSVNGYGMTPAFSPETTEYNLYVGQGVDNLTIAASPLAGTSSVSGTGSYPLNYGNNTITITCTSQNGTPQEYHLLVVRSVPEAVVQPTPETPAESSGSESGQTGEEAQGGESGQTGEEAQGGESAQTGEEAQGSESAPTGEEAQESESGQTGEEAQGGESAPTGAPQMPGDLNGDGRISNLDLVLLQKRILGILTLSEKAEQAADINHDGVVNNVDMIYLKKHILGIQRIVG